WAYKHGRELARRMKSCRGEHALGHPKYPEESANIPRSEWKLYLFSSNLYTITLPVARSVEEADFISLSIVLIPMSCFRQQKGIICPSERRLSRSSAPTKLQDTGSGYLRYL
ncbi:hypothetical protein GYMLUDRAFT_173642, partial [Collybiopsis luxurians FD-317 M1]